MASDRKKARCDRLSKDSLNLLLDSSGSDVSLDGIISDSDSEVTSNVTSNVTVTIQSNSVAGPSGVPSNAPDHTLSDSSSGSDSDDGLPSTSSSWKKITNEPPKNIAQDFLVRNCGPTHHCPTKDASPVEYFTLPSKILIIAVTN